MEIGERIAKRVQELMNISTSRFLEWYDYEREAEIGEIINGYKNESL